MDCPTQSKYVRAVWRENGKKVEGTIPDSWIEGNNVRWPIVYDATKSIERRIRPARDWKSFELIKTKLTSGRRMS